MPKLWFVTPAAYLCGPRRGARLAMAAWLAGLAALPAQAQVAPIKAGLWDVQLRQEAAGQAVPNVADQLQKMPPAQRAQIEAMMKKQGVAMGADGSRAMKVCYTREMLDANAWQERVPTSCKTEYLTRSADRWTWRTTCPPPGASVSDGEAVFKSSDAYTVRVTSRREAAGTGKAVEGKTQIDARWLGADCGSIKPMGLPPKGRP
jgi:hypothetical protein